MYNGLDTGLREGQFLTHQSGLVDSFSKSNYLRLNLVACYELEVNGVDSTGLSGTLVNSGVTYSAGVNGLGSSAEFNSNTDTLDIPSGSNTLFSNGVGLDVPFSVSLWVNFTSFNSASNFIINKRSGASDSKEGWSLSYFSGNFIFTKLTDPSNTQGVTAAFTTSTNTWYHVVVTDDGSKTIAGMKIYVNGTLLTNVNNSTGIYNGMGTLPFVTRIGQAAWTTAFSTINLLGKVDKVYIWKNRVLDTGNVSYLSLGKRVY